MGHGGSVDLIWLTSLGELSRFVFCCRFLNLYPTVDGIETNLVPPCFSSQTAERMLQFVRLERHQHQSIELF